MRWVRFTDPKQRLTHQLTDTDVRELRALYRTPFGVVENHYAQCDGGRGRFLAVDPTSGAINVLLPKIGPEDVGAICTVKNTSASTNGVTIYAAPGDTIEGAQSITSASGYYCAIAIAVNRNQWIVVQEVNAVPPYVYHDYVYVVGSAGNFWKSDDGGGSWTQIVTGTAGDLYCIYGLNKDEIYFAGTNGSIYKYDGSTVTINFAAPNAECGNITCLTNAFAGMVGYNGRNVYNMYFYTKSGETWSAIKTASSMYGRAPMYQCGTWYKDHGTGEIFPNALPGNRDRIYFPDTFPAGWYSAVGGYYCISQKVGGISSTNCIRYGNIGSWSTFHTFTANFYAITKKWNVGVDAISVHANNLYIASFGNVIWVGGGYTGGPVFNVVAHYDGSTWTERTLLNSACAIHGINANNVWFLGVDKTADHLTKWNGAAFETPTTIASFTPCDVWSIRA